MDGIEGFVVAVDDLRVGGVAAAIVIGDIAILVLYAAGWRRIVFLRLIDCPCTQQGVYWVPYTGISSSEPGHPILEAGRGYVKKVCSMGCVWNSNNRYCNNNAEQKRDNAINPFHK